MTEERRFEMTSEGVEAVEHIAARLPLAQRRALLAALHQGAEGAGRMVLGSANEHSVAVLKRGPKPLVEQEGMVRYLTPLGIDVARILLRDEED